MSFEKNPASSGATIDVFGPTVEFLATPEDEHQNFCVLRGTIPPGTSVPLHSHPDTEAFFVLSGALEVLRQGERGYEWVEAKTGDYIQVSAGTRHAWRNPFDQPAVQLIVVTKKLGHFFRAIGRPATERLQPPTLEDLKHFAEVSDQYGYWNATPKENAAVGIRMSFQAPTCPA